uniref:Ring finger protein 10 n=3 Tax=Colobinae TaxID=9569 RepID=A0A2K6KC60_RHIBE
MPLSSPNAAATASDMDKNSGSNSSSASSGSSKGQQQPRSASAGPAGESKPKSELLISAGFNLLSVDSVVRPYVAPLEVLVNYSGQWVSNLLVITA